MRSPLFKALKPHAFYGAGDPLHDGLIIESEIGRAKGYVFFYRHSEELRIRVAEHQSYSGRHLCSSNVIWDLAVNDYVSCKRPLDKPGHCAVYDTRESALTRAGRPEYGYALTLFDIEGDAF